MVALADLWLPILLAAVAVFVVSSVIHMVLPIHKSDYRPFPNEDAVRESLRNAGLSPGNYVTPHASSMKEMSSPEMIQKMNEGPVGYLTLLPNGPWPIGKSLLWWFLYSIVIGVFVAYLGSLANIPAGSEWMTVFRFTATTAVLGYALSNIVDSIWKGVAWSTSFKFVFDGLLYGLATGAVFASMWPGAGA